MKRLKLLLLALLLTVGHLHAQWEIQLDLENYCHLDRIFFLNDSLGWTIGGATIGAESPYFYTTNGGQNWVLGSSSWDEQGTDIAFVNPDTGFIAATDGLILKTINGGQDWVGIQTPATQDIMQLFFVDENNGWAALGSNNDGHILKSENVGESWEIIDTETDGIKSFCFLDSNNGWLVGWLSPPLGYGVILKTNNGGNNFVTQYNCTMHTYFEDIFFCSELIGWAVGQKSSLNTYFIIHTKNGGETWEGQTIEDNPIPEIVNCVCFVNDTIGWIGTGYPGMGYPLGAIYLTNDGGQNWLLQQEFEYGILDIQMLDQNTGWAVGGDFVYHINTGGVGIKESLPENFDIIINPNPTMGIISLVFPSQLPVKEYALEIASINGTTILKKIINNQDYTIDISKQARGIYFITLKYKINNKTQSLTKKIIKL